MSTCIIKSKIDRKKWHTVTLFLTWFNWNELIKWYIDNTHTHNSHTDRHVVDEERNAFSVYHFNKAYVSRVLTKTVTALLSSATFFCTLLRCFWVFSFVGDLMLVWRSRSLSCWQCNVRNRQFYRKSASRSDYYFRIRVKTQSEINERITGLTVEVIFVLLRLSFYVCIDEWLHLFAALSISGEIKLSIMPINTLTICLCFRFFFSRSEEVPPKPHFDWLQTSFDVVFIDILSVNENLPLFKVCVVLSVRFHRTSLGNLHFDYYNQRSIMKWINWMVRYQQICSI